MKNKNTPSDKIYKLISDYTPLSYILPSRHSSKFPLLWYDEEQNVNRALRYSTNQKSPFEDQQDGNAIVEPIIFDNGFLSVPKSNPVLQEFLHYHPMNGIVFTLVDKERDAEKELEEMTAEIDAIVEARKLTIEQLETVYRVAFGKDPGKYATAEIRRDIIVMAKKDPKTFLNLVNDPMLQFNAKVRMFFDARLLTMRNNNKEVWLNTQANKRKLVAVPFGEDPTETMSLFLKSDDGIEILKFLESQL